jgi:LysR family transcriptional regulator of beta-lactamase
LLRCSGGARRSLRLRTGAGELHCEVPAPVEMQLGDTAQVEAGKPSLWAVGRQIPPAAQCAARLRGVGAASQFHQGRDGVARGPGCRQPPGEGLEQRLGVPLFRRLPRGLALTDEGQALLPAIAESFGRMRMTLEQFERGHFRGIVSVGVVGTFATGWLLSRLPAFEALHPFVDVRIQTNNNRVDLAGEGLDFAVRYGDGSWRSTDAVHLLAAPLSAVCAPQIAERISGPRDLADESLLRSCRADEWPRWFAAAGLASPPIKGAMFDSSITMAEAAAQGAGVALLPVAMFELELSGGRLVQPFNVEVAMGDYWLTSLKSKRATDAMRAFGRWIVATAAASAQQTADRACAR